MSYINTGGATTGASQGAGTQIWAPLPGVDAFNSASIAQTNILNSTAGLGAGLYKLTATMYCSTAGTGNVTLTIGWNDSVAIKTFTSSALSLSATTNAPLTVELLLHVLPSNPNPINYSTTYVATGQYYLGISVTRVN